MTFHASFEALAKTVCSASMMKEVKYFAQLLILPTPPYSTGTIGYNWYNEHFNEVAHLNSGSKSRWRITSFPTVLVAPGKAIEVGTEKVPTQRWTKMKKWSFQSFLIFENIAATFGVSCSSFWVKLIKRSWTLWTWKPGNSLCISKRPETFALVGSLGGANQKNNLAFKVPDHPQKILILEHFGHHGHDLLFCFGSRSDFGHPPAELTLTWKLVTVAETKDTRSVSAGAYKLTFREYPKYPQLLSLSWTFI